MSELPESIVQRIKAEEHIRYNFRLELESQKKPANNKSRLWTFLNSSFGLFLLGSVFLSGIGSWWTHRLERTKENESRRAEERRLLAEYDFRLNEIDNTISLVSAERDPTKQGQLIMYIWEATRGQNFQPALKEYKDVHLAGIIIQLDSLGLSIPKESAAAIAAARDLDAGVELAGGVARQSGGYRVLSTAYLQQRDATLHSYRDEAWAKVDPDHGS